MFSVNVNVNLYKETSASLQLVRASLPDYYPHLLPTTYYLSLYLVSINLILIPKSEEETG